MRLYLTPDDEIVLTAQTRLSSIVLGLIAYEVEVERLRLLTRIALPLTGGGTVDTITIRAGKALLETCQLYILSGTVKKGEVAAVVTVRRLSGGESYFGYASKALFPSSLAAVQAYPKPSDSSPDDGWYNRILVGTDPGAGAEVSETVPAGLDWELVATRVSFVTDATVANRRPHLIVDDGTNVLVQSPAPTDQGASTTTAYQWSSFGQQITTTGGNSLMVMPNVIKLEAGYRVRTSTVGIVAGDNYGAPVLTLRERLTLAR